MPATQAAILSGGAKIAAAMLVVAAFLGGMLHGRRLERRWLLGGARITARSGMPIENRYIKDWPIPGRQEMPNP